MPAERPASTKASENRRATKPIMEKRRRARINQCLSELKGLILDALNKDPSRHSKLEKADILEMTVRHLQNVQRQQMAAAISTDHTVLNKFRAGFSECANEVSRYVSRIEGVEQGIRQRLVNYLSNCVNSLNAATPFTTPASSGAPGAASMAFPGMTPPFQGLVSPLHVQIPAGFTMPTIRFVPAVSSAATQQSIAGDINNNTNISKPIISSGLPLLPSRLPNGDLAFLVPASQTLSSGSGHFPLGIPVVSSSSEVPSTSSSLQSRSSLSSWSHETTTLSPTSPLLSAGSPSPASSVGSGFSLPASDEGSDMSAETSTPTPTSKPSAPSPTLSTQQSPKKSVNFADHLEHHPLSSAPPAFQPTSVIQKPTCSTSSSSSDMDSYKDTETVWRPW